jgi:hypothetical protein
LAGSWSAAFQLSGTTGDEPYAPQALVDETGIATVVWSQASLWAARVSAAAEPSAQVSAAAGGTPAVAGNASGSVMLAWASPNLSPSGAQESLSMRAATFHPNDGWSATVTLSTLPYQQGLPGDPQVALSADGWGLVVWRVDGGTADYNGIWVAQYRSGQGWSSSERLTSASLGSPRPAVTVGEGGAHAVAWIEQSAEYARVMVHRGNPGTPELAEEIARESGQAIEEVWVNADPQGSVLALWLRTAGEPGQQTLTLSARMARANGPWQEPVTVREGLNGWWYALRPRVAFSATGRALVTWRETSKPLLNWQVPSDVTTSMMAAEFAPGMGWRAPEAVATGLPPPFLGCAEMDATNHDAAIDAAGNAAFVWERKVESWRLSAEASYRPANGTWSAPTIISDKEAAIDLPVISTGGGAAVAVWLQNNSEGGRSVWLSRLAP